MDREKAQLNADYEKLYAAYYNYDLKVLKLIESNPNVYWAKDSSAYVVKSEKGLFFSFYKKPRMDDKYYVLWKSIDKVNLDNLAQSQDFIYVLPVRIDTLKSHELLKIEKPQGTGDSILVSSVTKISLPAGEGHYNNPAYVESDDLKNIIFTIHIK